MSRSESRTCTLTCDRCGKTETVKEYNAGMKLTGLYIYADRPAEFQGSMCNHMLLLEMCEECMIVAVSAIGDKAIIAYREHQESMKRYRQYR